MKIEYESPKGKRIKSGQFTGLDIWSCTDECWVWSDTTKTWSKYDNAIGSLCNCNTNIKSLKSAIRHLQKHEEIPRGLTFRLWSKWQNYSINITK